MHSILDTILQLKNDEIKLLQSKGIDALKEQIAANNYPVYSFYSALKSKPQVGIIAELKKASPSKGIIRHAFDPLALAKEFEKKGAVALSVLTEKHLFLGNPDYIPLLKSQIKIPILRKDFILDPIQLYESKALGADAVLLIKAILEKTQLKELLQIAAELEIDTLLELHTLEEVISVRDLNHLKVLGINNRNLYTFEVDTNIAKKLYPILQESFPENPLVAESGYKTKAELHELEKIGFSAILVGEALAKDHDLF